LNCDLIALDSVEVNYTVPNVKVKGSFVRRLLFGREDRHTTDRLLALTIEVVRKNWQGEVKAGS